MEGGGGESQQKRLKLQEYFKFQFLHFNIALRLSFFRFSRPHELEIFSIYSLDNSHLTID